MPRPLGPAFHAAPVRDALGVVRLLFALEREGTDITRTAQLTEIGRALAECLELGRDKVDRPETLGYRAAVSRSADAVDKLAAMVWPADVAEVVRAAQARVKGLRAKADEEREVELRAAEARGGAGRRADGGREDDARQDRGSPG